MNRRGLRVGKYVLLGLGACIVLAAALWLLLSIHHSPVPKDIRKGSNFSIYYPEEGKMPSGYTLDKTSFRKAEGGVVLFSVSYDNGRSMVFSEQAQPGSDVIDKFKAQAIPVNTKVNVPLGQAVIGAYGSGNNIRTVASLPITRGPWLIITAPSDINQNSLKQVLNSLTK